MTSIYLSDYSPRGIRSNWERCSVSAKDAQSILAEATSCVTDACGWFDEQGRLRVLVADTGNKERLTYRTNGREFRLKIERLDRAA